MRSGYSPVPLPLRLLGIRELLCDNCNYLYRAFSPLPPRKPHRPRHDRKADVFAPGAGVDLQAIKPPAPMPASTQAEGKLKAPLLVDPPRTVDPAAASRVNGRLAAHICPHCGSDNTKRRRRRLWQRAIFALSGKRPYLCNDCDKSFYDRHHSD